MAVLKRIGLGTVLKMGASTATLTEVAGIISISGPEASAETVTEMTLDSTTLFMDKYKAGIDAGDVSLTLAYGSSEATQKTLGTALASTAVYKFSLFIPGATDVVEEFTGYVTALGRSIERAGVIQRTCTVAVTGDPGYPTS